MVYTDLVRQVAIAVPMAKRCFKPTVTVRCRSIKLKALPVAGWCAPDCRMFLWTTDAHLPQALELGAAWGFADSTVAFVWAKQTKTGNTWAFAGGKATRKGAELCLLFLRGKLNRRSASVRQLIVAPVREHSRKPDETYARIEQLVDGPYLELWARQRWPGWDCWGDEVDRYEYSGPATA